MQDLDLDGREVMVRHENSSQGQAHMSSTDMRLPSTTGNNTLAERFDSIKRALGLDMGLNMARALQEANRMMKLADDGTLMRRAVCCCSCWACERRRAAGMVLG